MEYKPIYKVRYWSILTLFILFTPSIYTADSLSLITKFTVFQIQSYLQAVYGRPELMRTIFKYTLDEPWLELKTLKSNVITAAKTMGNVEKLDYVPPQTRYISQSRVFKDMRNCLTIASTETASVIPSILLTDSTLAQLNRENASIFIITPWNILYLLEQHTSFSNENTREITVYKVELEQQILTHFDIPFRTIVYYCTSGQIQDIGQIYMRCYKNIDELKRASLEFQQESKFIQALFDRLLVLYANEIKIKGKTSFIYPKYLYLQTNKLHLVGLLTGTSNLPRIPCISETAFVHGLVKAHRKLKAEQQSTKLDSAEFLAYYTAPADITLVEVYDLVESLTPVERTIYIKQNYHFNLTDSEITILKRIDHSTRKRMIALKPALNEYIQDLLYPKTQLQTENVFSSWLIPSALSTVYDVVYTYYTDQVYGVLRLYVTGLTVLSGIVFICLFYYLYHVLNLEQKALLTHVSEVAAKLNAFNIFINKTGVENIILFGFTLLIMLLIIAYLIIITRQRKLNGEVK